MNHTEEFERENKRTKEHLDDIVRFLSHDTSFTRKQLVEVLRQRADLIESEVETDSFFKKILKEEK